MTAADVIKLNYSQKMNDQRTVNSYHSTPD